MSERAEWAIQQAINSLEAKRRASTKLAHASLTKQIEDLHLAKREIAGRDELIRILKG